MEDAPKQELHETTLIEPEVVPTDREENLAKNDNLKQRQHDATGTGDESYEDEEEWDCCSYTKAIAAWVFALILGFCVFGFMIAYASQSQDDTGTTNSVTVQGGNIEVCGANNFMLRDGVCDDATNNEKCHWDGGDCCADKSVKDDFFCKDCKCNWTVDAQELTAHFKAFQVRRLQDPIMDFDPIHVEKTVVDMASKKACDAICSHKDLENVVNAWSYKYSEMTCTCAWLTSQTCDWDSIVAENDLNKEQQTVAYIQLTKTIPCSCQKIDFKLNTDQSVLTVKDNLMTKSSWHCREECLSNRLCHVYSWHLTSMECMIVAVEPKAKGLVLPDPDWISGAADCAMIDDLITVWKEILLIAGGMDKHGNSIISSEVLVNADQDQNWTCSRSFDLPISLHSTTGNVIIREVDGQKMPVVCGGVNRVSQDNWSNKKECYILDHKPKWFAELSSPKEGAASVLLHDGQTLWVAGGAEVTIAWTFGVENEVPNPKLTSDFISASGGTYNPQYNLPIPISGHCMVVHDASSTVFLIGGLENGKDYSDKVWINDLGDTGSPDQWRHGTFEDLPQARESHSCGVIQDMTMSTTTRSYIVIFGGYFSQNLATKIATNTVESMELTNNFLDPSWKSQPEMPIKGAAGMASVVTSDKKTLIALGGTLDGNGAYNYIFQCQCRDGLCEWKDSEFGKLKTPRSYAVAMILPMDMCDN